MKAGCVERAIVSAGGPKISCQGQGIAKRREGLERPKKARGLEARELEKRVRTTAAPRPPSYSEEEIMSFESFYANATAYSQYVPMDWSTVSGTQSSPGSTITAKPK